MLVANAPPATGIAAGALKGIEKLPTEVASADSDEGRAMALLNLVSRRCFGHQKIHQAGVDSFGDHSFKLERYREDLHGPNAWMARTNRQAYWCVLTIHLVVALFRLPSAGLQVGSLCGC